MIIRNVFYFNDKIFDKYDHIDFDLMLQFN